MDTLIPEELRKNIPPLGEASEQQDPVLATVDVLAAVGNPDTLLDRAGDAFNPLRAALIRRIRIPPRVLLMRMSSTFSATVSRLSDRT